MKNSSLPAYKLFLSTPSARRATEQARKFIQQTFISIHALREEGDHIPAAGRHPGENFYPRPPRGGRRLDTPLRFGQSFISIHALREEGDASSSSSSMTMTNFYPRPPRGGRRIEAGWSVLDHPFLSTPSARRATRGRRGNSRRRCYFYPRPPRGGRQQSCVISLPDNTISIHALREEGDFFSNLQLHNKSISIHALREEGDAYQRNPKSPVGNFYPRPPRGGRQ